MEVYSLVMNKMKKILLALMILCLSAQLVACKNTEKEVASKSGDANPANEITLEIMGKEEKFDKIPEKVVAVGYDNAEILTKLGLEDKIVGLTGCMYREEHCYPELSEKMKNIKILPDGKAKGVPSFETVLSTNADMIYCLSYHFTPDFIAPLSDFVDNNIKYYVSDGTYKTDAGLDVIGKDIENLGKIFRIEEKANELKKTYDESIKEITNKVKDTKPVDVFVFDFQDKAGIMTPGGKVYQNNLLKAAGANNVFSDVDSDFHVATLEEIIARDPDYIILVEYWDENEADEKIKYLESLPELKDVTAIKNKNYIRLKGIEYFPSLHSVDGLKKIAEVIHPDKMK